MTKPSDRGASVEWVEIFAGCVVKKDNKYLMVQEKIPKAYGLWNVPAGYVDKGETIEQAAVRETKEESGYDVQVGNEIGVYHEGVEKPVKHAFEAEITGGDLLTNPSDVLAVKWFSFDEITKLNEDGKIRAQWVFDALAKVEGKA